METLCKKEFIILNKSEIVKENFKPPKNHFPFSKLTGGLWASTYRPGDKYISAWHKWCCDEEFCEITGDAVILRLKPNSNIFIIESKDDLISFIHTVGEVIKEDFPFVVNHVPNFEEAAKWYDAILLTERGQRATSEYSKQPLYNLQGWDCESLLILNFDCIGQWEYIEFNWGSQGAESCKKI